MADHNEAMRLADSIKTRAVGWTEWRVENPVDGGYVMVFTQAESLRPEKEAKEWLELHKQHHPNSMYADYVVAKHHCYSRVEQDALDAAALLRQQAERIAELEKELQATSGKLQDLQSLFDYVKERRAQISHRLWVWAHEELTEPLKTRYFNIVANGTADVMEQPTYAQQYNGQKHRAEAAEAERDQLREEVERLRASMTVPTIEPNSQNWQGMDGAIAFHLIERHADSWADAARMMHEWRDANAARTTHKETE